MIRKYATNRQRLGLTIIGVSLFAELVILMVH